MPSTAAHSKKAAYPGNLTGGMPVSPYEVTSPVINSHGAPALSPRPHLQPDFGLPSTSAKGYYSPSLYGSSVQQPSIPPTEQPYYGPSPTNYFSSFLPLQDDTTHANASDLTPTPPAAGHGSGSGSPHVRYASHPAGSQGHGFSGLHGASPSAPLISPKTTFKPLVPPPFRESKELSPFASPADSPAISPAGSPPRIRSPALASPPSEESLWSPSASSSDSVATSSSRRSEDSTNSLLSSPESDATSVPDSPASGSLQLGKDKTKSKGPRPSNALEFSHFLDRVSTCRLRFGHFPDLKLTMLPRCHAVSLPPEREWLGIVSRPLGAVALFAARLFRLQFVVDEFVALAHRFDPLVGLVERRVVSDARSSDPSSLDSDAGKLWRRQHHASENVRRRPKLAHLVRTETPKPRPCNNKVSRTVSKRKSWPSSHAPGCLELFLHTYTQEKKKRHLRLITFSLPV